MDGQTIRTERLIPCPETHLADYHNVNHVVLTYGIDYRFMCSYSQLYIMLQQTFTEADALVSRAQLAYTFRQKVQDNDKRNICSPTFADLLVRRYADNIQTTTKAVKFHIFNARLFPRSDFVLLKESIEKMTSMANANTIFRALFTTLEAAGSRITFAQIQTLLPTKEFRNASSKSTGYKSNKSKAMSEPFDFPAFKSFCLAQLTAIIIDCRQSPDDCFLFNTYRAMVQ